MAGEPFIPFTPSNEMIQSSTLPFHWGRNLQTLFVISALLNMMGCTLSKGVFPTETYFEPQESEGIAAQEVSDQYAVSEFSIEQPKLKRYGSKQFGVILDGKKMITIEYYDPVVFPNWKNMASPLGGFPAYFSITIEIINMKVIDHYASPE